MAGSVAALLTCHNRREKTLACLRSLLGKPCGPDVKLTVYLLDDGCSDGTADAVKREFPHVHLLEGDGSFFWNGGMRAAFGAAIEDGHDFYLWLNDDVELCDGFLANLLETYGSVAGPISPLHIIAGAVKDPSSGEMTYSGLARASRRHPLKFKKLPPDKKRALECETMNGNCVLIPHAVVELIGNLDPVYIHQAGDMDYGFRARAAGAKVWIAPGYVGECEPNRRPLRWDDPDLSLRGRLKIVNSPHGLPFRSWFHFARRHGGWAWPIFAVSPYFKAFMPKISLTGRD